MTESNAGWRLEKDHIVGGYVVYCGDEPVASCPSKKDAAEIVENARAAKCWRAITENDWCVVRQDDTHYKCIDPGWHEDVSTKGSGPTPIEAVEAALRLKGGIVIEHKDLPSKGSLWIISSSVGDSPAPCDVEVVSSGHGIIIMKRPNGKTQFACGYKTWLSYNPTSREPKA